MEIIDSEPAALVPLGSSNPNGIWIGAEHPNTALSDFSVVGAPYRSSSDGVGHVVLVGPIRMAYSTAMAAVKSVAKHLERLLS